MNKEDEKKIPVTVEQVRQFLKENQDPEYREYHGSPSSDSEKVCKAACGAGVEGLV